MSDRRLWLVHGEERAPLALAALTLFLLELGEGLAGNAADALYLARVGPAGLGWQLALSSATLVITLGAWGALVDRFERARLLAVGAAVAAGVLVLLHAALAILPAEAPHTLLVVTKQLAAALDLGFWVLIADRFDARQARRLLPPLFAAGGLGLVGGALATRGLAAWFAPGALFLAAALAHALAALVALRLADRRRRLQPAPRAGWRAGLEAVRQRPLARRLVLVVAFAGATGPLVYSALGAAAAARLPGEEALASFYGTLRAATHGLTLVAQLLLAPLLWRRLGVAAALVLAPLVALASGLGLVLAPGLVAAAVAQGTARLADATLQTPAEKLAQNLLPAALRGRVAGFLDGVGKRAGAIAGGALAALVAPGAALVAVAVGWAVAAALLARRYGALAVDELAQHAEGEADEPAELDEAAQRAVAADLRSPDETRATVALATTLRTRGSPRALLEAALVVPPARRRRLLAAVVSLPPGPLGDLPARLAARLAELDVDERVVVARLLGDEARLARLASEDPAPAVRLVATLARLRRLGEREGVELALDTVLAVSPAARAEAARALVLGRRQAGDPAAEAVALTELVDEVDHATGERRERLVGWLLAAAHAGRAGALAGLRGAPLSEAQAHEARELAEAELDEHASADAAQLFARLARGEDAGRLAALLGEPGELGAAAQAGLLRLGAAALPALVRTSRSGRRRARLAALAVLAELRAAPAELDELLASERQELWRTRAHRDTLLARRDPVAQLLLRRLGEREAVLARTLLLVAEVRGGLRRLGAAADRWAAAGEPRARARALEAIDALLPARLGRQLLPALEELSPAERRARAVAELGTWPSPADALAAELAGRDELARRLAAHALGPGATRQALADAARAGLAEADASRLLRRLARVDDDAVDMPGRVDTMATLAGLPLCAALSAEELADVAAVVRWDALAAGEELDPGDGLLVVASGRLRGDDGELAAGAAVGVAEVLGAAGRERRFTVLEAATVGRLRRAELERLCDEAPRLALGLARGLATR